MSELPEQKMPPRIEESDDLPFDASDEGLAHGDEFVVNYFNYFTEVEEHFVRRRGKHLYVSPLDWAAIQTWKEMGIPLHIVLRGIDRVFDAYEASPRVAPGKLINSVLYCQQEVLTGFEEYQHARVGSKMDAPDSQDPSTPSAPFSKEAVLGFLTRRAELVKAFARTLEQHHTALSLQEVIARVKGRLDEILRDVESAASLDLETVEQELTRLETVIYEALLENVPSSELETVRKEGRRQLRQYKSRMSPEVYQQTLENYVAKRLRENYQVPYLSLFYM